MQNDIQPIEQSKIASDDHDHEASVHGSTGLHTDVFMQNPVIKITATGVTLMMMPFPAHFELQQQNIPLDRLDEHLREMS